jgi:A/G-specific adenine glycosylase
MLGGLWEFPGGTQEQGESLEECIARELYEELGLYATVGGHFISVRHAYSHFSITLHAHWARIARGRPRARECRAYRWVDLEGLRALPFSRADLHIIDALEAVAGQGRPQAISRRGGPLSATG